MKKTKQQIEKRLLEELQFKAKLTRLSPDGTHELSAIIPMLKSPEALMAVEESSELFTLLNMLFFYGEEKRMVDACCDEEGYLHIKVDELVRNQLV